jgi:hypothetical protein
MEDRVHHQLPPGVRVQDPSSEVPVTKPFLSSNVQNNEQNNDSEYLSFEEFLARCPIDPTWGAFVDDGVEDATDLCFISWLQHLLWKKRQSRPSSQATPNPWKPTGKPLTHLGRTERLILHYLATSGLAHQFRIADIVHATGLSNKVVFNALARLVKRGFVVKKARGVYALSDWVIARIVNKYPVTPAVPQDVPKRGKASLKPVESGWGVLRVHAMMPGVANWLQFFAVLYFIKLLINWLFNGVKWHLSYIYGPRRLRQVMSYIYRLTSHLEWHVADVPVVLGCHGHYNGSPGAFSPLTDCVGYTYEHGIDVRIPGWLAQVLDSMFSIFKVYVKSPSDIKRDNPGYYQDLIRELGEPPPMPEDFTNLVSALFTLLAVGGVDGDGGRLSYLGLGIRHRVRR